MKESVKKPETRIIPEQTNPKFYAQHLKPYEFVKNSVIGKIILEVGCGDGYGSSYLAKVADRVIGIDYEKDVVKQAQDKYRSQNLDFVQMDATKLQFENSSFDIICSFQVIEHIPEDRILEYLTEIKRVLRNNGEFYVSTLNLEHTMKSPLAYKKNPAHCKEFNLKELRELLSQVFPCVEIYGLHLTLKHRFFQRLKKIGIFNLFPNAINPVGRFYSKVTTGDSKVTSTRLREASDFICICKKYRQKSS